MIEETGGTEWDLREAENGIVAAESRRALQLAMRRHTEAQRNMMQSIIVPSFVDAVGPVMDTKLAPVLAGQRSLEASLDEARAQLAALQRKLAGSTRKIGHLTKRLDHLERRVARLEERDRASSEP